MASIAEALALALAAPPGGGAAAGGASVPANPASGPEECRCAASARADCQTSGQTRSGLRVHPPGPPSQAGLCRGALQPGGCPPGTGQAGGSGDQLAAGCPPQAGLCRGAQQPGEYPPEPGQAGGSGGQLAAGPPPQAGLCRGVQQPGECPQGPGQAGGGGGQLAAGCPPQAGLAEAHNNLGNALQDQGKLEEAVGQLAAGCPPQAGLCRSALQPGNCPQGTGQAGRKRWPACSRPSASSRTLPRRTNNLGMLWLLQGDFERGWPEYEWRWRTKDFACNPSPLPRWDGSPLQGKTILLYAEQGLGDTIQFIRYAPLLQQRGAYRPVPVPARPAAFARGGCGSRSAAGGGRGAASLRRTGRLAEPAGPAANAARHHPGAGPLPGGEPDRVEHWRKELEPLGGFKVGIVWQGNPDFRADRQRSIPLRHYEALARVEGVRLVSLQKGPGGRTVAALAGRFPSSIWATGWRLQRHSGGAEERGPGDLLMHRRAAPGRGPGRAGVAGPAVRRRLALAAASARTARGIRIIACSASAAGAIGTRSSSASRPNCAP